MPLDKLLTEICNKISQMTTSEFTDLLMQIEDENNRELLSVIYDTLLQQKQRQIINAKKF